MNSLNWRIAPTQVPIPVAGKLSALDDPCWERFTGLIDGRWVRHRPHVESQAAMVDLLREASGFVIQSQIENWCLSAREAAACGAMEPGGGSPPVGGSLRERE